MSSGSIFNIFGDSAVNPVHKQLLKVNAISKENTGVGKGALTSITPARKVLASCTPQASQIKKTFLQNRGALSVGKPSNLGGDRKANIFQNINKNNLQIYEDRKVVSPSKTTVSEDDLINIKYSGKPYVEDDGYLSDSDAVVKEENIDKMIFDVPEVDIIGIKLPECKFEMFLLSDDSAELNDTMGDAELDIVLDSLDLPEVSFD